MMDRLKNFWIADEGQDLVEYALLAAFLAVVSVAGLQSLGPVIAGYYSNLTTNF
jgi:Flp pilus assembly pilin Flp